jgi:uncharacterized membrane protein
VILLSAAVLTDLHMQCICDGVHEAFAKCLVAGLVCLSEWLCSIALHVYDAVVALAGGCGGRVYVCVPLSGLQVWALCLLRFMMALAAKALRALAGPDTHHKQAQAELLRPGCGSACTSM